MKHHKVQSEISATQRDSFDGLRNATCENQTSDITLRPCRTYSQTLNLCQSMKTTTNCSIESTGRTRMTIGVIFLQDPLDLNIVIDASFLVLKKGRSPPPSHEVRDRQRSAHLSTRAIHVIRTNTPSTNGRKIFLDTQTETWKMMFIFNTENEFRTSHRTFGNPFLKALEMT